MTLAAVEEILINIVRKCISQEEIEEVQLSSEEIQKLLLLSAQQQLYPMVYDYLSKSHALKSIDRDTRQKWQKRAVDEIARQVIQTNELLNLILYLQANDVDPIVVKGIMCRNLYPVPLLRPSVDEDVLIRKEEVDKCHDLLMAEGYSLIDDNADIHNDYEVAYHKKKTPVYIERHTKLFDPEADGYQHLNSFFTDEIFNRTETVLIDDVNVRTLSCTDHLLFLIFHVYKHFIYSGVGIRPICDIGVFADCYGERIDWTYVRNALETTHIFDYVRGLFNFLREYLMPNSVVYGYIADWNIEQIDIEDLLNDILNSGVFGASSKDRLHTSNMTLDAVEGHKGSHIMSTLFPSVRKLKKRYPYLEKRPFLLPIAWMQRLAQYYKETVHSGKTSASASLKLGLERIELLKKYNIID